MGKKPSEYLKRTGRTSELCLDALPEDTSKWPLADVTKQLEAEFEVGKIDAAYVMFTHFKSAMNMSVETQKVLPMDMETLSAIAATTNSATATRTFPGKNIVEPSVEEAFVAAIARIFRVKLLQAALDSKASEHASRMTAMDAATKNAGDLIKRLQLKYNKLRQAGITGELLDIIGGAEAVN